MPKWTVAPAIRTPWPVSSYPCTVIRATPCLNRKVSAERALAGAGAHAPVPEHLLAGPDPARRIGGSRRRIGVLNLVLPAGGPVVGVRPDPAHEHRGRVAAGYVGDAEAQVRGEEAGQRGPGRNGAVVVPDPDPGPPQDHGARRQQRLRPPHDHHLDPDRGHSARGRDRERERRDAGSRVSSLHREVERRGAGLEPGLPAVAIAGDHDQPVAPAASGPGAGRTSARARRRSRSAAVARSTRSARQAARCPS